MTRTIYLIMAFGLLSGCSSTGTQNNDEYERIILEERQELKQNIKEVAEKAYDVQRIIKEVENARALKSEDLTPDVMRNAEYQASYIPVGMEREISIDWTAYPEELLELLANASGYQIDFIGNPYPIARVINVGPERRSIKRLIDDVEANAKNYIKNVDIYEGEKLIIVNYE